MHGLLNTVASRLRFKNLCSSFIYFFMHSFKNLTKNKISNLRITVLLRPKSYCFAFFWYKSLNFRPFRWLHLNIFFFRNKGNNYKSKEPSCKVDQCFSLCICPRPTWNLAIISMHTMFVSIQNSLLNFSCCMVALITHAFINCHGTPKLASRHTSATSFENHWCRSLHAQTKATMQETSILVWNSML